MSIRKSPHAAPFALSHHASTVKPREWSRTPRVTPKDVGVSGGVFPSYDLSSRPDPKSHTRQYASGGRCRKPPAAPGARHPQSVQRDAGECSCASPGVPRRLDGLPLGSARRMCTRCLGVCTTDPVLG